MLKNLELTFEIKGLKKYRFLLPYLVVILIIFFTFSSFQKQLNRLKRLRQDNEKEEKAIVHLRKQVSQIESISVAEIEGRISQVLFALPSVNDPVLVLSSAKALALMSGVT